MLKRLPYTLLFLTIALAVMLGPLRPYVEETGQLTPFLTTRVFFQETVSGASFGLFRYVGLFLQATLLCPWVGVSLLAALLIAIAYTTRWAFRMDDSLFGLCWILPLFFLSTYTEVGYGIYLSKRPLYLFFAVLPALLAILAIGIVQRLIHKSGTRHDAKANIWCHAASIIAFATMSYYFWTKTYRDENFLNILEMKHATERDEWERVLTLSEKNRKAPTRLQVCLTRLALYKTGRMGDRLFSYSDGDASYDAPVQQQWLRLIGAPLLYYHYGKLGFAYRWAMEDMVEYGMRPVYLRTLHRVALLNGEEALARKYEDALQHTLFYHEDEANIEKEAKEIRPLTNYTDQLDGDNGLVEFYLLQSFAMTEGGSREMVEMSLMCSLITKQLDGFWPRFMVLLPGWEGNVPRHYQEAALMVAQLQGGIDTGQLPIADEVRQRFERLVEASARMGDNAGNAYSLRPEFGDTYWYYYFFVEGLKTN